MASGHGEGRDEDGAEIHMRIHAAWTEWNLENVALSVALLGLLLILRLLHRYQ